MTLPADFWTTPQPGGLTVTIVGAALGIAFSLYYFNSGSLPSSVKFRLEKLAGAGVTAICAVIGGIVGELIVLWFR